MELLKVEKINKNYSSGEKTLHVLKNIDFCLNKGDFISLMGPSGSGKSTLLNIMGTMDFPSSGSIHLLETNLTNLKENELAEYRLKHFGFIYQFHYLLPEFTILENVAIPAMLFGKTKQEAFKLAEELMEFLNILERGHHYPSEISGGEKQRAAIGRALINRPDILLADEPTGNLDHKTGQRVLKLFQKIHQEFGQTLFIVTHDEEVSKIAQKRFTLIDGKLN
ncbi:MAG: ABC transporter ATP-binding protein [Candidatus Marinimicrobia bacterium]|jgi:lipoprotein-releasing system ATP-binding protein|nr:ABC transporter ATP-binding protein [Candidatus Neomarinimicrobiota bacterium]